MSTTLVSEQLGLTADPVSELREAVSGAVIAPGDADYDRARTPWVVNIDQHPVAVLEVADVEDVVQAVRWARRHGLSVAAQPTGHAPRRLLDGALLLRTRGLQGIRVDHERKLATVGAGVKFGELCAFLDGTGLMALAGSNADPSVVGLSLGGGVSWFTRKHGFTANSIVSFDVVDAEGRLVEVTAESDPELFWALRGGGGDFAVVVRATLRLFDAPELYGGQLLWSIEHAEAVLKAFRDLAKVAPRELTLWAHVLHFPDVDLVPPPLRGRSFVNVASTYIGSPQMAEILLWSLRDAAPVEMDMMRPFQPSQLTEVAAEPSDPMPAMEHSLLLTDLDDRAIEELVATVSDPARTPLMLVQIRGLGGAFADDAEGNGAVRPVTEPFQLFALGIPMVPELEGPIEASFAAIDAVVGRLGNGRRMPNFVGHHQDANDGYEPATLARLQDIKRRRDPRGVIRSNKPVLGV
ncbi:MAG: FAD-binding oxidoreductase [Nocardioidaceae bacterium]